MRRMERERERERERESVHFKTINKTRTVTFFFQKSLTFLRRKSQIIID